jgi:hypothetical protein
LCQIRSRNKRSNEGKQANEMSKRASTHADSLLVCDGDAHGRVTVVKRVLPRVHEEHQSQLPRAVRRQCVADRDEVLERLGHLAAGDGEVTRVEEVAHPVVVAVVRLPPGRQLYIRPTINPY